MTSVKSKGELLLDTKINIYLRILAYLKPYRAAFLTAVLCMVLFGASDGAVPFLIKYMLDGVFTQQNKQLLYILPAVLIAFAVIRAFVDFGQQYMMAKIGHRIVRDIRSDLNNHFLKLAPEYYVNNSSANLLSRVTSDVLLVRTLLTETVAAVLRDAIRLIALLVSAIYLDPLLALLAFVVFPIGIIPVYKFGRKLRKLSKIGQDAIGSLSAIMQESMLGNRIVKIFGMEDFERERFDQENEKLSRTFIKSEKVKALSGPINEVLASTAISGIILYGGFSVISGVRSQGDFVAFIIAVFLMYDPFKKLSRVNNTIQQGIAGADRIFEVLDTEPTIKDQENTLPLPAGNKIEFINVSFQYKTADTQALTNINLTIEEGQKVALVGFSGSGKSTMVDLLPRFIEPTTGLIKVGGTELNSLKIADLRSKIALVGQHTFLFNDTVFNNIQYGNRHATRDQVYEAARAAYAYEFITQLPKGFDTFVGEAGLSLSGGERQRLAIARAILKNAPILILDEATASLDNRAEREVQSAIEALEKGKTSLIVAHRLSTVRNVDRIIVMKDGFIVESGTHEVLLERNGEYSKLHNLQFSQSDDKDEINEKLLN